MAVAERLEDWDSLADAVAVPVSVEFDDNDAEDVVIAENEADITEVNDTVAIADDVGELVPIDDTETVADTVLDSVRVLLGDSEAVEELVTVNVVEPDDDPVQLGEIDNVTDEDPPAKLTVIDVLAVAEADAVTVGDDETLTVAVTDMVTVGDVDIVKQADWVDVPHEDDDTDGVRVGDDDEVDVAVASVDTVSLLLDDGHEAVEVIDGVCDTLEVTVDVDDDVDDALDEAHIVGDPEDEGVSDPLDVPTAVRDGEGDVDVVGVHVAFILGEPDVDDDAVVDAIDAD